LKCIRQRDLLDRRARYGRGGRHGGQGILEEILLGGPVPHHGPERPRPSGLVRGRIRHLKPEAGEASAVVRRERGPAIDIPVGHRDLDPTPKEVFEEPGGVPDGAGEESGGVVLENARVELVSKLGIRRESLGVQVAKEVNGSREINKG